MSSERKPLLSDDAMYFGVPMDQARPDGTYVPGITRFPLLSAGKVRDFYENLITTGKLRVVEEVDYDCDDKELRRIIQVLVNDMATLRRLFAIAVGQDVHVIGDSMDDAKRIGITPSNTP